ncbi:MAG: hypothetical protein GY842_20920, partial [bacterium]|nr:hypothetical protein [bacterium]
AQPCKHETDPLVQPKIDPELRLKQKSDRWHLQIKFDKAWAGHKRSLATTETLGKAKAPDLPYEDPNGKPYRIDTDYFGKKRNTASPYPGPFELPRGGKQTLRVWP